MDQSLSDYRGKHISPWRLSNVLIQHFGGYKTYESVTYKDRREYKSAYCYLNKFRCIVRISDHLANLNEKRRYEIEIITSFFNLDVTVNGTFLRQLEGENKTDVTNKIIRYLSELTQNKGGK